MDSARGGGVTFLPDASIFQYILECRFPEKNAECSIAFHPHLGGRGGRLCNCHMITPTPSAIVSTSGKYKIQSTVVDPGFLVCAKL